MPLLQIQCFRDILRGSVSWLRQHTAWQAKVLQQPNDELPTWLDNLAGLPDGVLMFDLDGRHRRRLRELRLPFVDLRWQPSDPEPTPVHFDPGWISDGVRHLLDRGYARILIAVPSDELDSEVEQAIAAAVVLTSRRGVPVDILRQSRHDWHAPKATAFRAKAAGSTPLGVLCWDDHIASSLSWVCQREGLAIPGQVGLLGSNDDPIADALAALPLSSVQVPFSEWGRLSMAALARLIAGKQPARRQRLLPSLGVLARASTALGTADELVVRRALNLGEGRRSSVAALAATVGCSRSALSRRSKIQLGHPLAQELRRRRVLRLREGLASGRSPGDLARELGMSLSGLYALCRRELGSSPGRWADRRRGAGSGH